MSVETPAYSHFDESNGRVVPLFNVIVHYTIRYYGQHSYKPLRMIPLRYGNVLIKVMKNF